MLAIDDDLHVTQLYQRYLEPHGYTVISLTNPKNAARQAKELQPAAITLDLMMPEMDGWQVLQALKNDPKTRHIPVIICSLQEEEARGFSLGAADFLVKPFLADELLHAIERLTCEKQISDILFIDDSPEDLQVVQKSLEAHQAVHVHTAQNDIEAFERLKTKLPDVILMDLFMPDLDGFALINTLRADPLYSSIPVIILADGELTPEHHQQLSALGQQLINKSTLRENDLLNTLQDVLRNLRK